MREFRDKIRRVVALYFERKASRSAAECSYFITLSFFPFLICLNWLLGLHDLGTGVIEKLVTDVVPDTAIEIINNYLNYLSELDSTLILIIGVTFLVTSGSRAFRAVTHSMEDIYGVRRSGFWQFVMSLLAAVLVPVGVYLSMLILITGGGFLAFASSFVRFDLTGIMNWTWLRYVVLLVLIMAALGALYRYAVPGIRKFRSIVWGLGFGTVALVAVSFVFSRLIEASTRYSLVYGSLASVIILMTWLYTCSNIIIIGGIVNFVFAKPAIPPIAAQ
ncbi:YhjD/YihY/BrkB family envelope integrity protein [Feifania hominis]|uniref:YihY/virulence factor BrkB family protein n=1 Tax=Feifania hominis TaxID=2763660 RepID=A0A926HU37_9FIRM|nr:YihY/virulence factor BrkB family protein [Feifania hominis]